MLLSKIIKIKWNPSNKKWYEKKGYLFTKWGDEFEVKVEDLTNGSDILVEVKCDCETCDNPFLKTIVWNTYNRCVKSNGKYYCNKCATKLFGTNNMKITKLKNGKSFEQWCIETLSEKNTHEIISRWDYEKNGCKPSEVCYSSGGFNRKGYWFKCPKNLHSSELKSISHFTNRQGKELECDQCNSFAQWGIDNIGNDFLEKYWDYEKNNELGIDPWRKSHGSDKRVWIKCQEKNYHGSYFTIAKNFSVNMQRCPFCTNQRGNVHYLDSLGTFFPHVVKLWSDKNNKSAYQYPPMSEKKVWWKCECGKHEDYFRGIATSNQSNFKCPICVRERKESFLQEKVRQYLESMGYSILHESNCTIIPQNPKHKGSRGQMPYDNEIKELKLIVEVHGQQHYKEISGKWFNKNFDFNKRKLYDRYKRIYAKSKGYNYLEIPYWTDNAQDEWKTLIKNKIDIVKSQQYDVDNKK